MLLSVLLALTLGPTENVSFADMTGEVRADPPPVETTRGLHYVNSDEKRHDLFRADIAGTGGMFIGVGAFQNYVMAAWAKSDALVIIDFDQVIIDLHHVFAVAFRNSESPQDFLAAWHRDKESREQMLAWIDEAFEPGTRRRAIKTVFRDYRTNAVWGFHQVLTRMGEQNVKTYLDDLNQYRHLKKLFANGRVLAIRGDFTGRRTLTDVAQLARKTELAVNVIYLSNIEQYFTWGKGRFRDNMVGLPFGESASVLRVYGFGMERTADENYRYYVQPAAGFAVWLHNDRARSVKLLLRSEQPTEIHGFYRLPLTPEEYEIRRKAHRDAKAKKKPS